MDKLTKRQKEMLDFVKWYLQKNNYSLSYMEIADYLGVSSSATIHQHVKSLEEKGYLKSHDSQKRALEPVMLSSYRDAIAVDLPLVGLITAGEPIEAIEQRETHGYPFRFCASC